MFLGIVLVYVVFKVVILFEAFTFISPFTILCLDSNRIVSFTRTYVSRRLQRTITRYLLFLLNSGLIIFKCYYFLFFRHCLETSSIFQFVLRAVNYSVSYAAIPVFLLCV